MTRIEAADLLMLRYDAERQRAAEFASLLKRFPPGGTLFSRVDDFSAEALAHFVAEVGGVSGTRPFLAIAEDSRIAGALADAFPLLASLQPAAALGTKAIERLGDLIGQSCALIGFNTYFSSALEIDGPLTKSFDSDPRRAAMAGKDFVRSLRRRGILACARDFPGRGAPSRDASERLPILSKTMAELWRENLAIYRELGNDLPLIEIGVVASKAYDFDVLRPAMVSSGVIQGLLRSKLGYDGVVISDVARTVEVTGHAAGLGEVAIQALAAGADLIMVEGDAKAAETVVCALSEAIESGALSAERVGEARRRLHLAKAELQQPPGKVSRRDLDHLTRRWEEFSNARAGKRGGAGSA